MRFGGVFRRVLPWTFLALTCCQDLPAASPAREGIESPVSEKADPPKPPPPGKALSEDRAAEALLERHDRELREGYPILPGDELGFTVLGQPELSFEARVPAGGSIDFPMIGKVRLAGRSPEQVRAELADRLGRDYFASPDVTVLVKAYAPRHVYVLGAVGAPREYEVPSGRNVSLLQTIARAGGFREAAAKDEVLIFRLRDMASRDRVTVRVDAVRLQKGRARDPFLMPEDIVFVPERERVYVLGQVARPGAFVIPADHGLMASQAIALAGGFTRIARDSNVRLIRREEESGRKVYVLDMAAVVEGRPEDDVPLQPGDVIFVPESMF